MLIVYSAKGNDLMCDRNLVLQPISGRVFGQEIPRCIRMNKELLVV